MRERKQPSRLLFEDPEYQEVDTKDDKQQKRGFLQASDSYESETSEATPDSSFEGGSQSESSVDSNNSSDFDILGRNDASRGELLRDESGEEEINFTFNHEMPLCLKQITHPKSQKIRAAAHI